jgi:hypothetical protein
VLHPHGIPFRFPNPGGAKQFVTNHRFKRPLNLLGEWICHTGYDGTDASNREISHPPVAPASVKWRLPQTLVICLKIKLERELNKPRVTKAAANHSKPVGRIVAPYGIKTSTREPELRAVENVEELGSKL